MFPRLGIQNLGEIYINIMGSYITMLEKKWIHNLKIYMEHILGSYRSMQLQMFLRIQMCKNIHMISLQDYGGSGDKVQGDMTTAKQI